MLVWGTLEKDLKNKRTFTSETTEATWAWPSIGNPKQGHTKQENQLKCVLCKTRTHLIPQLNFLFISMGQSFPLLLLSHQSLLKAVEQLVLFLDKPEGMREIVHRENGQIKSTSPSMRTQNRGGGVSMRSVCRAHLKLWHYCVLLAKQWIAAYSCFCQCTCNDVMISSHT